MQKEVYPHWNIKHDDLVVRFLPDLNEDNPFGIIDQYHFHLIEVDGKNRRVLCSQMHEGNRACLHCKIAREAWHNDDDTIIARKYFRKKQRVGNVIIMQDPIGFTAGKPPATYQLLMPPSIFEHIKDAYIDSNMLHLPTDYKHGRNFLLRVVTDERSPWKKYDGKFLKKSKLTKEQIEFAENSRIELSTLRPTESSADYEDELSKQYMWNRLSTP